MEIIHTKTGKVVAVQKSANPLDKIRGEGPGYITITAEDGSKVLVHQNINSESLVINDKYAFNKFVGDIICQQIAEGLTIHQICKKEGMPSSSVIHRWMRENDKFHLGIQEAREIRAESFADELVRLTAIAEVSNKDQIPGLKLASDNYKWLAEKNGKKSYGAGKNSDSNMESHVQIIVNTGIVRDNAEVVEVKVVKDNIEDAQIHE